jgi:cytochrome c-type biogenesis protein CcmH/NrfG
VTVGHPDATGAFRQHPLPTLLHYLARKEFTGLMAVVEAGQGNQAYFRAGNIVACELADRQIEPIGRLLLDAGVITDEIYNQTLMLMAQNGQPQEQILLATGAATEEQVTQAHAQQLFKKVVRMFKLRDGEFALFRQDHEFVRDPLLFAALRVNSFRAVYHGIRYAYDLERIHAEVGHTLDSRTFRVDPKKASILSEFQFARDERVLVDMLQSQHWDVPTLMQVVKRGELEVLMVTYALLATEMLELRDGNMAASHSVGQSLNIQTGRGGGIPEPITGSTNRSANTPASTVRAVEGGVRSPERPAPRATAVKKAVPSRFPVTIPKSSPPTTGQSSPPATAKSSPPTTAKSSPPPTGKSGPPASSKSSGFGASPTTKAGLGPPPVAPDTGPPLSPEAAALKKQINDRAATLDKQNNFEVLGIGRDVSREQVKAAYIALARVFHPDRLAQFKLEKLRPTVETIFARMSDAQAVLMDDSKRAEYVRTLDGKAKGDAEKARKLFEAEEQFRQGELALRRKEFEQACEHFRKSMELNPEEGEHVALYGYALYQTTPMEKRPFMLEKVRAILMKGIKLGPQNPRPHCLAGEIFLAENELDRAVHHFRVALELREDYVDAERGVRLAMMRKEKEGKKGGGLFGLSGKSTGREKRK